MRWSFAYTPNACHGDAHIGHLWVAIHLRFFYAYAKIAGLSPKWNVYFDVNSREEHEKSHLAMLDWLGWPPDSVLRAREWRDSLRHTPILSMITGIEATRPMPIADEILRMLYWNSEGVFWHVRGADLEPLQEAEEQLRALTGLRLPRVFHVPLLADENGGVIESEFMCRENPEYLIKHVMEAGTAVDAVTRLASFAKAPSCGEVRSSIDDGDDGWLCRLLRPHWARWKGTNWQYFCSQATRQICVPKDWTKELR